MPAMTLSLPAFIGLRYVHSKRGKGFFSLVSIFSFGAMTLGIMALIIVLSVMNGFDHEIKNRILNVVPHLTIDKQLPEEDWQTIAREITHQTGVVAATAYLEGQGMLSSDSRLIGVSLQGILPDAGAGSVAALLADHMLAGTMDQLQPGEFGVVIGSLLARSLNLMSGDSLLLTLPDLTVTPVGVFPRVKRVRVVGVYQVGAQVDTGIAFMHMRDLQLLLRQPGQVQGLRISVSDPFNLASVEQGIMPMLADDITKTSWQQSMSTLFQAIKLEKTVVGLLLAVIVAVAAFNIIASLVLMVADKRSDIAVLRAMGATSRDINRIFCIQGATVGFSGVILGTVLGCLLAWKLSSVVALVESLTGSHIFDPNVFFISQIPSQVQWMDVAIIATLGAILSLLATLYPAYRAGLVSPAEILRYDH
jgi:lipoprotein-releasing system permease protein